MATQSMQTSKNDSPPPETDGVKGTTESNPSEGAASPPSGAPPTPAQQGAVSTATEEDQVLSSLVDVKYVQELNVEKQTLDQDTYPHSIRLLSHEINRVTLGRDKLIDLHNDKPTKISVKVRVPVHEFPKFNFIGKIIGPKGNTLRRMQEETGCRMAVFGRGSMRDKEKEEELRAQGGKYAHLNEELHVYIESFGHPIDAHRQLSFALHAIRSHLVPDYNDEITQGQVQELAYLNGGVAPARGRGRGMAPSSGYARVPIGSVAGGVAAMPWTPQTKFVRIPENSRFTSIRGGVVPARGSTSASRGGLGAQPQRGGGFSSSATVRRPGNYGRPMLGGPSYRFTNEHGDQHCPEYVTIGASFDNDEVFNTATATSFLSPMGR